ncbi:tetratricopeptide repeat protein [Sorangium sp. So ce861]|uniref:tetratricopeptide repeat protein n=1 Tax=Sorangium sp. So ce861 TaxID=3133323 RepID=UPI003F603A4E
MPAELGGGAATAEPGRFEQVLGPERGVAYRRFVEWSVGAGFMLAVDVHRDELARRFALPWVLVVHPAAALALQRYAPDFCDFAGLWLPEEPGEEAEPLLEQAIRSPATSGSTVRLSPDVTMTPNDLLSLAHEAAVLGHLDQAADLLAQYDMKHPDARAHDVRRMHMDGLLLRIRGHLAEALARLQAALDLGEANGDRPMIAALLEEIAHVRMAQGDLTAANHLVRRALELFEQVGDQRNRAASMYQLSTIELLLGKQTEALQLARESQKLSEGLGDQVGRSRSLHHLSVIERRMGNHAKARELLRESLMISDELGDWNGRFASLLQLATLASHEGDYAEARERLREALKPSRGSRAITLKRESRGGNR